MSVKVRRKSTMLDVRRGSIVKMSVQETENEKDGDNTPRTRSMMQSIRNVQARSPKVQVAVNRQKQVPFGFVSPEAIALLYRRKQSKIVTSQNAIKITVGAAVSLADRVQTEVQTQSLEEGHQPSQKDENALKDH